MLDDPRDTSPYTPEIGEPVAVIGLGSSLPAGFASPDANVPEVPPRAGTPFEVTWRALEDAGIVPQQLAGSDTGVFVGIGPDEVGGGGVEKAVRTEAWTGVDASICAVAHRVSHVLDLRGPSITVDPDCSAAPAAVHLACESLRFRDSRLALAFGVGWGIASGQAARDAAATAFSDGGCPTLVPSAPGAARDDIGVLVLKRLADARRDRDRVLAVIRGGLVGQGVAPEERLLRLACANAGVPREMVDHVETLGTATTTAGPFDEVLGRDGHDPELLLEAGAGRGVGASWGDSGVAAVIRVVLALHHGELSPDSAPDRGTRRFPRHHTGRGRLAVVSALGHSGTTVHLVLEEAPAPIAAPAVWKTERLTRPGDPVLAPTRQGVHDLLTRPQSRWKWSAPPDRPACSRTARPQPPSR